MTLSTRYQQLCNELLRYGLVSAVALAADFSCLLLLARWVHYLLAASISFILGGAVAYYLSIKFVFTQRKLNQATIELGSFIGLGLVGLGVNTLIMSIAVSQWSFSLALSKMLAAGGTFTCNFALRKWLLFSRTPVVASTGFLDTP